MKNKFLKFKDNIKSQIAKFEDYVNDYTNMSSSLQIPNVAYMDWGIKLAANGNLTDAIEKLKTASLMYGEHPSVYTNLGIALLKQKDFEGAIKNFRKAVKLDKFNSKAYAMWASALSEIGDLKGAVEIYNLAQKYDPRDPDIYLNWGVSLAKAGRKQEAEEKFKKSVALNPLNPITPFLWAVVLFEQEKYKEAIDKFNHCLLYSENQYETLYYLALSYLKMSDYESAKVCAKQALEIDSSKVDPYIILADCYMHTCKQDKCLQIFNEAEEKAQTNAQFYTNWGMALQKYGYIDEAREKLTKAYTIDSNHEIILFNLGVNYMLANECTQAEEYFSRVLKINPFHPSALLNIAALAFNRFDFDYALKMYNDALNADKKNYSIYFNIANCYYRKKDFEQAKNYFKKCIEYCPNHVQAYLNYSNLLIELGDFQEAKRKARAAYLLDKTSAYTNFAYGVVLLKLGEFFESEEKFSNAIKIDINYNLAYLGLCEVYINLKKYDLALENLQMVSSQAQKTREFDELESRVFDKIANSPENGEEISQYVLNCALEYCNKFLELYNNDKVLVFKNILLDKFKLEVNE